MSNDDRWEILALMNEYAYTLDSGDHERHAQLFDDAEMLTIDAETGQVLARVRGVAEHLQQAADVGNVYDFKTNRTKHVTTNITIDLDDDGQNASARAYITVFQAVPPQLPLQPIFAGRYEDRFTKREGVWHFKQRKVYTDCVGDMSMLVSSLEWNGG